MGTIVYAAKRSLIAIHSADSVYTLNVGITEAVRTSSVQKTTVRSIGGDMETLRNYADKQWDITFEPVAGNRLEELREFLDSTDAGEEFAIDIYGNSSTMRTMKRTDEGHTEQPFMRLGSETGDYFQISITAIEA